MNLLDSKTNFEQNIENIPVGVLFDAIPASPIWHEVKVRISLVFNSLSDTTRDIRVVSQTAGGVIQGDTTIEVTNNDADEPSILIVGPFILAGSDALSVTVTSDKADFDTDIRMTLLSDDHDYALRFLALAGEAADTIAQRLEAMDDLTQASGNGDLAAILGDTNSTIPTLITSEHSTTDGLINGLNDFDPDNDDVAVVTLVETLTTYTGNTKQTGDNFVRIGAAGVGLTAVALVSTGLDAVLIDGVAYPSAIQYMAAVLAGKISGAGTGTEIFVGLDGLTTRVTVTVDASGNRTGVALVP